MLDAIAIGFVAIMLGQIKLTMSQRRGHPFNQMVHSLGWKSYLNI
jgi:hypothetical protein